MPSSVVLVVGACGGVGTSTLAALVARRLSGEGRRVALVDLATSGGLEVVIGTEGLPGGRWADLREVRGTVDPADLGGVLPRWRDVDVLSSDRRGGAREEARAAVWAALVAGWDVVVADVPVHGRLPATAPADAGRRTHVVVVTGQDVLGVAGALALRDAWDGRSAHLVLRRRRHARVSPLEAARVLDLPLTALLPTDRGVAASVDRGLGPQVRARSALGRAVGQVARAVADV